MPDRGGAYESDATQIARLVDDEIRKREKRAKVHVSGRGSGFFPGGASDPEVNKPGPPLPPASQEPTYFVEIAPSTTETVTFVDKVQFGGMDIFFDYYRGTGDRCGMGRIQVLMNHDGSAVKSCVLREQSPFGDATANRPGFDSVAIPPRGISAALSGDNIVLSIAMDGSDANDTSLYLKPVYRSRQ